MATKEFFIKDRSYSFEKSVPNLIDMNLSKVTPYKQNDWASGLSKTVMNYAKTAQDVEQRGEVTRLKTEITNLENEFKTKYLSNPNAFNNEENRAQIANAYNGVIAQKKQILQDGKVKLSDTQYQDVDSFFRQQTSNTVFKTQTDINQSYVKEAVDKTVLGADMAMEALLQEDDSELRNQIMTGVLEDYNNLKYLGVDVAKMQLDYAATAQEKLTEVEVKKNIVDNFTNPRYFKKDSNGNIEYLDPPYNTVPVIDVVAKQRDLMGLQRTFLSDAACKQAGDEIAKATGINPQDAFNYVRNRREGEWMKASVKLKGDLDHYSQLQEAKAIRFEEQQRLALQNKILTLQAGDDTMKINAIVDDTVPTNKALWYTDANGRTTMEIASNGAFKTPKEMFDSGITVDLLPKAQAQNMSRFFVDSSTTAEGLANFSQTMRTNIMSDEFTPQEKRANAQQLALNINNPYATTDAILAVAEGDERTTKRMVTLLNTPNLNLQTGYGNKSTDMLTQNPVIDQALLKDMMSNSEDYGLTIPDNIKDTPEMISFMTRKYREDSTVRSNVDRERAIIAKQTIKAPMAKLDINVGMGTQAYQIVTNNEKQSFYKTKLPDLMGKHQNQENVDAVFGRINSNVKEDIALPHAQRSRIKKNIDAGLWKVSDINNPNYSEYGVSLNTLLQPTNADGTKNLRYDQEAYNMVKQEFINGFKSGKYHPLDVPEVFSDDPDISSLF